MKQLIGRTLAALALTVVGMAGMAHAQSATIIKVDIPFEFSFGGKTFPAGIYAVEEPAQHVLVLHDERGQAIATAFTSSVESMDASASSRLTFRTVDGQKVLSKVWRQNFSAGEELRSPKTTTNSNLAKQPSSDAGYATGGSQP